MLCTRGVGIFHVVSWQTWPGIWKQQLFRQTMSVQYDSNAGSHVCILQTSNVNLHLSLLCHQIQDHKLPFSEDRGFNEGT